LLACLNGVSPDISMFLGFSFWEPLFYAADKNSPLRPQNCQVVLLALL
jgi:hypothetical protein